jgi:transcriptional regulator with XRE-family HTH domain
VSLQHKPFAAQMQIRTWGQALARCRIDKNMSHREVADRAGVGASAVRDWEMGIAYPTRPQLKRLVNLCFRQLQYFTGLLPTEFHAPPSVKPADPDEAYVPPSLPGPPPPELAPPPEPKTFREALRRAREDEGLHQRELAEMMDVTEAAVGHWETGTAQPYVHNYEKLLVLFPSLASVPRPKDMKAKPVAKVMALPVQRPPAPAPVAVQEALPADRVSQAGSAYALAMAAVSRAVVDLETAKARIGELEKAVEKARADEKTAHESLVRAVSGATSK